MHIKVFNLQERNSVIPTTAAEQMLLSTTALVLFWSIGQLLHSHVQTGARTLSRATCALMWNIQQVKQNCGEQYCFCNQYVEHATNLRIRIHRLVGWTTCVSTFGCFACDTPVDSQHMCTNFCHDAVLLLKADRDVTASAVLLSRAHVDTDGHKTRCCHCRKH